MEIVTRRMKNYHTDSNCSTPFVSAPSSPKFSSVPTAADRYDYYYAYTSAPTSPARALAIYDHFNSLSSTSAAATTTTTTNTNTNTNTSTNNNSLSDDDFAFDFSGHLEKEGHHSSLTAADELFDSGIIRPLNPIPKHQIKESTRDRGRERPNSFSPSISHPHSRSRKGSRSLSPLRRGGTDCLLADKSPTSPAPSAAKGTGGIRKWRLRDLLLFRSASEGRATGNRSKDPLSKYTLLTSSPTRGLGGEDSKNSSFRSTASNGARPPARSAHEKHYTANRAAAEELKKKTALPYRQGLFGCLRFNPAVNSIARGFSNQSFNHRR